MERVEKGLSRAGREDGIAGESTESTYRTTPGSKKQTKLFRLLSCAK
jgi:hypothetical protein